MRSRGLIQTIDTHTCGEPTRIVTGGVPPIPGATMAAKQAYVRHKADDIRRFLMREPRGHRDMFGAILTPAVSPEADFGVLFVDNEGSLTMCGHATIGVGTALVEVGLVTPTEPVTTTRLGDVAALVALR